MASSSVSCSIQLTINSSHTSNPATPNLNLRNGFLRIPRNLSGFGSGSGSGFRPMSTRLLGPSCGSRVKCWFKFGKNGVDAEGAGIYGSQSRDEFDRDDVEQYFNYSGMLATEGTYDKLNALLSSDIHPVDILLLMAASEGDKPKIEELLRAGATYDVKGPDGKTALDRADDEIRDFILNFRAQKA